MRHALVDHADALIRWERGTEVFSEAMGQSVLVTEAATWQRQRRMLQAGFTPGRVAAWAPLTAEAAQVALDTIDTTADVDMDALLTLDVILRTMLSERAATEPALDPGTLAWAVQQASRSGFRKMFWPVTQPDWLPLPGKAAKRCALRRLAAFVALLRRRMAARRADDAAPRDDILGMLLGLRDDETGEPLSDQEIIDQCLLTFQAGHETTATALQWWSHLMATHPVAAQRAAAEVDACLGTDTNARTPTAGDAAALPWLMATLKEAMRLYPPAAMLMQRFTLAPIPDAAPSIPQQAITLRPAMPLRLRFMRRAPGLQR